MDICFFSSAAKSRTKSDDGCRCRYDEGVALCESLLRSCPESCALRDALADLHILRGNTDQAVSMWLHALAECPHNAEVFYHCCKFLMAQVTRRLPATSRITDV